MQVVSISSNFGFINSDLYTYIFQTVFHQLSSKTSFCSITAIKIESYAYRFISSQSKHNPNLIVYLLNGFPMELGIGTWGQTRSSADADKPVGCT